MNLSQSTGSIAAITRAWSRPASLTGLLSVGFHSDDNMSVYTKLNAARKAFHAIKLEKTGENKFAKYKYFELGDFLIPALGVFSDAGLCAVVSFTDAVATMTIVDTDDGSQIVLTSPMGSADLKGCHVVQNIGAVETYQRRYLWVAALEIVEHDALDATTGSEKHIKGPGPINTPKQGIGDDLPEDWKIFLRDLASEVTFMVKNGKAREALDRIDREKLEADQHVFMDSHIDSATRAMLKKTAAGTTRA